mgnify:CR=1 FL=1
MIFGMMYDSQPDVSVDEGRLLDRLQAGFPLVAEPYGCLAEELELPAADVRTAIQHLRDSGVIRRIGASYVPARLGYVASLVAAEVCGEQIEVVAARANRCPGVTHNYERAGRLNLWFTVIAASTEQLHATVSDVASADGVRRIHLLPALETFKLRVQFRFAGEPSRPCPALPSSPPQVPATSASLDSVDKRLICRTCGDIGTGRMPYADMADELGLARTDLLERLRAYRSEGRMRRFGAILRHYTAGFAANGMTVWNAPDERAAEIGRHLAAPPEVSHCYQRPRLPDWPYNLYTMIHGRRECEVRNLARRLAQDTGTTDFRILFSRREFKKASMVYFAEEF